MEDETPLHGSEEPLPASRLGPEGLARDRTELPLLKRHAGWGPDVGVTAYAGQAADGAGVAGGDFTFGVGAGVGGAVGQSDTQVYPGISLGGGSGGAVGATSGGAGGAGGAGSAGGAGACA